MSPWKDIIITFDFQSSMRYHLLGLASFYNANRLA
jgi:hypothetical protein